MVVILGTSFTWFCKEIISSGLHFFDARRELNSLGSAGRKCLVSSAQKRHIGRIKALAPAPPQSWLNVNL